MLHLLVDSADYHGAHDCCENGYKNVGGLGVFVYIRMDEHEYRNENEQKSYK